MKTLYEKKNGRFNREAAINRANQFLNSNTSGEETSPRVVSFENLEVGQLYGPGFPIGFDFETSTSGDRYEAKRIYLDGLNTFMVSKMELSKNVAWGRRLEILCPENGVGCLENTAACVFIKNPPNNLPNNFLYTDLYITTPLSELIQKTVEVDSNLQSVADVASRYLNRLFSENLLEDYCIKILKEASGREMLWITVRAMDSMPVKEIKVRFDYSGE